ncbi:EAL domain, c-di-GMP-specific phosphodiesterase class I (or its enzymatically inactive variant) [Devosia crocina]|uniref:EAL domain, c-di-GMP-specific phosphodiesterase class I (Or its enzymatically inactive variant) n=1 Tax=Devosia crocina TaxID=429728 RepID=A0A1I7NW06_9HYPH|nr:EAL domain-containing protein [Devosia crocina]SFV38763.1 EAL domain, c-di-GMP-specific phosphodiesterase class I (or its enzymatically inactive variant) [Devosia crocina]
MSAFTSRLTILTALFALLTTAAFLGAWVPADAKLWELRFRAADRAPSGDVIFVDIDASSLAEVGIWPWPRSLHGRLLDQLMHMGAYEVAFDIDFSNLSSPAEDHAFASSLNRAGGYAYLATFRQLDASGTEVWNHPIPILGDFAQAALVNVDSLEAGMVWSLPGRDDSERVQSIAGHFNPGKTLPDSVHIDYSIDMSQIVRVPASAVLDGTADPNLIDNRQVVIGSSALELHDLLLVPRFGVVPGPVVQIGAVETVRQNRALTDFGLWPAAGLSALFMIGSLAVPRLKLGAALVASIAAAIVLELATNLLFALYAIQIDTTLFYSVVAGLVVIRLLEERAVRRRELRLHHERLEYLAHHDEQTGALSQFAWCARVGLLENGGAKFNTLLLRLDALETTGASLGFAVADQVVVQFYRRLMEERNWPVGRIESRTFAVAVDGPVGELALHQLWHRLEGPYDVEGHLILISLRYGISDYRLKRSAADALQEARTALAMASRQDKKGCTYNSGFETELENRRALDIALRGAIERNELDIEFQLQVDTSSRAATGVEALLRWTSPEFGRVSPARFIPIAEENGAIVQLGSWVAHEACRRAVANGWQGRLSVNVSPVQFASSNVVEMIRSALQQSGFSPLRLDVEVTESLIADGEASILEALTDLRALGVSIAVDDFGTGHSSLSHIAALPVDKLKIDMSFVRQITSQRGVAVAETIVQLGSRLDLSIVVEGVETQTECDFFAGLGCHTVQGYLFGRPGPLPASAEVKTAA